MGSLYLAALDPTMHLYLAFNLARCWLIEGYLDALLPVGHHCGAEGAKVCAHLF